MLRAGTQLAAALPGTYFVSLRSPSVGRSDQNSADRPSEAKKQGKNKANDGGQSSRQAVISINRSGMILNSATSAVWEITAAIVAIYTVKGTATYGEQVVLSRVANAIVANIQKRIFDQMLRMKVGYYSRSHSSEFIARQAFIAQSASNALNLLITTLSRDVLTIVGLIVVTVSQDPLLSLLALMFVPVAAVGVRKIGLHAIPARPGFPSRRT